MEWSHDVMEGRITSTSNPRIKQWSQLLTRKGREQQGKCLLEGTHLIQEALKAGVAMETILMAEGKPLPTELHGEIPDETERITVSEAVLKKCSETQTPQGLAAIISLPVGSLEEVLSQRNPLVVVVDRVQDPGNLGTIIRAADAAGATGVIVGHGSVDLYNPKTIRATMGSLFHLPIVEAELLQVLPLAKERGIQLMSTSPAAAHHCYAVDLRQPSWLILGNEANGVSAEVDELVTERVLIPMQGKAESLNVAMAATVLVYEAMRQRYFN